MRKRTEDRIFILLAVLILALIIFAISYMIKDEQDKNFKNGQCAAAQLYAVKTVDNKIICIDGTQP